MPYIFEKCLDYVLSLEGGYSNDPDDSGGATDYGISLAFLMASGIDLDNNGIIDENDIHNLTKEQAASIYMGKFWEQFYNKMHHIAPYLFAMSVNAGPKQAYKILQRAINYAGAKQIKDDGIVGKKTLKAYDDIKNKEALIHWFKVHCVEFYARVVINKPSQIKFIKGWISRVLTEPK